MALTIPIVSKVSSFDATVNHTFYFKVIGGDQVVANEIKICRAVDGIVIYQNKVTMFNYNQVVPSNTLTNGIYYTVAFRTYNSNGDYSSWSTEVPFYCYTKPNVTLNITEGEIISNSAFTAIMYYSQDEGELLGSAHIGLYDSNKKLIQDSGDLFDTTYVLYEFSGLIENETYYLKGFATTVNDTEVETDYVSFSVEYDNPIIHTNLTAEVDNCNGWVSVKSTLSVIKGTSNYDVTYGDGVAELVSTTFNIEDNLYTQYVQWNENFSISTDGFTARVWFIPSRQGKFIVMKDESESFWIKGWYYTASDGLDYIKVTTSNGGLITSNSIRHETGRDGCMAWIRYNGSTWDVRLEALGTSTTNYNWNTPSNTYNKVMTDVFYAGTAETYTPPTDVVKSVTSDITSVRIGMGIFDHITITNDVDFEYSKIIPESMDAKTIIDCDFDENIDGGSAKIVLSNVEKIRIKRKDAYTTQWITLVEHEVTEEADLRFEFRDHFVPRDTEQTYALVPVISGDIEGDYITQTVTPKWNAMFVSDGTTTLKFDGNITYDSTTNNISLGLISPIGMQYPVVVQNSKLNYLSGSISGSVLGVNFDDTRKIDRRDVVVQTRAIEAFLTQGKAFGVIDWNGNVLICRTMASPSHAYNSSYGNGAITLSLSWVQQGKYNNEEDLKNCGLLNVGIIEGE